MGKGIAVEFKKRFNGVEELKKQCAKTGQMAFLQSQNRFIYYLVTKQRYFHKPTYQTLESSIAHMKEHMIKNKVTKLSMPIIGCGLDRLQWNKVKDILSSNFSNTGIEITVYHYQPPQTASPTPFSQQQKKNKRQNTNRGRGKNGA